MWSLGVILYELLTVRRAFRGTLQEVTMRVNQGPLVVGADIPESEVPTALRPIIEKATALTLKNRFDDANALGLAVDDALATG